MGLLDRATRVDDLSVEEKPDWCIPTARGNELIYPVKLFEEWFPKMKIDQGMVLLEDADQYFRPWASQGFDVTTLRKFRLTRKEVDDLFSEKIVTGMLQDYPQIKSRFSNRDRVHLESFKAFILNSKGVGAGTVFFIPYESSLVPYTPDISDLKKAEDELALNRKADFLPEFNDQTIEETILTASESSDSFIVILFNGKLLLNQIIQQFPSIQQERILDDIKKLLQKLTGSKGTAMILQQESILLFLEDTKLHTPSLITHQLIASLGTFFSCKIAPDDFDPVHFIWNSDAGADPLLDWLSHNGAY